MPAIRRQVGDRKVGDQHAEGAGLSGIADAECLAHRTARTIGSDQPGTGDRLCLAINHDAGLDAVFRLGEPGELDPEFHLHPQIGETGAQYLFRAPLGNHQGKRIGFAGPRVGLGRDDLWAVLADAVVDDRGIGRRGVQKRLDHPQLFENLDRAGLKTFAARSRERLLATFDDAEGDAPARQVDRQRQPGRAGAHDQDRDILARRDTGGRGRWVTSAQNLNLTPARNCRPITS